MRDVLLGCGHACATATVCMWRSEDFVESLLHVGPRNQTQVIRLVWQVLCLIVNILKLLCNLMSMLIEKCKEFLCNST